MTEPESKYQVITTDHLLSELRDRIRAEIQRHKEFRARELAADLVQLLNEEDPEFLPSIADRLLENEMMRQIDNEVRQQRTQALQRVRKESAAQKQFKLLKAVGEIAATPGDDQTHREAVISATRDLWGTSVTIAKNQRVRLRACTAEDLEFLTARLTVRANSFARNAIFYGVLRQLVLDNDVNTVGELPEEALEQAAESLGDEPIIVDDESDSAE